MAKMNSKFKYMFDAAPSVSLMAQGDAPKTASFNGAPITLDVLKGYWNPAPAAPADKTFAVIVNVTALAAGSARTATMTFNSVVEDDTFTISDGVDSLALTAKDAPGAAVEFEVGANNTETAANAAAQINVAYDNGDIAISATSAGAVITLTNHLGTGGSITEAETTITTTAFAGNNETYSLAVQFGPAGFGSSVTLATLSITKPGQYIVPIDVDTVKALKGDATQVRIAGTLAGVAPSITAYSWIAGVQK